MRLWLALMASISGCAADSGARRPSVAADDRDDTAADAVEGDDDVVINVAGRRISVPDGWSVVTEATLSVPNDGVALVGPRHAAFTPSIVVQPLTVGDMPPAVDDAQCAALGAELARLQGVRLIRGAVHVVGDAHGCSIAVESTSTDQAAVQYVLSDRERAVSVMCNRSAAGDAHADRTCVEILRAVWAR